MKAGRIVLLVLGSIFVLTSFGLLIGGAVVLTVEDAFRDQDGYYSTHMIELSADSAAIVTGPADFEFDTVWIKPNDLATLKIEAVSIDPDKEIFVGIARTTLINDYLDGVSFSEPRDYQSYHDSVSLFTFRGADQAPAPTAQSFWVASASGSGTQTLEWDIDSGRYSVVLMNADGSSPVEADVSLGVKVPAVVNVVGVCLLVSGFILLLGGGVMIFFGARGY